MAEPCGRRACTYGEPGVEAIIFDASTARTTVFGAWTVTGSGSGSATLDPGPSDFRVTGGCGGGHKMLEAEAAGAAAPAGGGDGAAAAAGGAIDGEAKRRAHG